MSYLTNVFINCPFDQEYFELLKSQLFTIIYCDFNPLISETTDSDNIRVEKIKKLIAKSKYSIHDLSRVEVSIINEDVKVPRFNMPFELGIDIGCKTYSKKHKDKRCLILEKLTYRVKISTSDISGQDIKSHNNEPIKMVKSIRDWLKVATEKNPPKYPEIWDAFNEFTFDYETEMNAEKLNPDKYDEIPFSELIDYMKTWIIAYKN